MDDEIVVGGIGESGAPGARQSGGPQTLRRFVPMKIGEATIFLEQMSVPATIEDDTVHPVALPSPKQAFEQAGDFLHECVRIFDARIGALARRPEEISIEFLLAFEVAGKATIIPVLLSGKASTQASIKVSAKWGPGQATQ